MVETESSTKTYSIKTAGFEGPLGLLLGLIEQRKLFINDLSLTTVTEDYLKYINALSQTNPEEVTSFIVVAATLILIKSKSLLPNLDLTNEEQGDIHNLEERLRLYELFTRLGVGVKKNFGRQIIFAAEERKHEVLVFLPDEQITREVMMAFARNVLKSVPQKINLPEVPVKKVISIEEMIHKLTDRIKSSLKMNFQDFFGKPGGKAEKVEVIVGFLAMLELVRRGLLNVTQESDHGDITLWK